MKRKLLILLADMVAVIISYGAALWLRFDLSMDRIPREYLHGSGFMREYRKCCEPSEPQL